MDDFYVAKRGGDVEAVPLGHSTEQLSFSSFYDLKDLWSMQWNAKNLFYFTQQSYTKKRLALKQHHDLSGLAMLTTSIISALE